MDPLPVVLLLGFGLIVGAYGTIVGAGGGFLVVPLLLGLLHASPPQAIGTSLAVVFLNAASGTAAFAGQRRIDYRTGLSFAAASLPGSVAGALLSSYFDAAPFRLAFGVLLLALAVYLVFRPQPTRVVNGPGAATLRPAAIVCRTVTDCHGQVFTYQFNERRGMLLSFFLGFFSSSLGIGGGIFQTPAMVHFFGFPTHIATATSLFVLTISTLVGVVSHIVLGHVLPIPALAVGAGALVGAQVGAAVAQRLHGKWLMHALSGALFLVGFRLVLG